MTNRLPLFLVLVLGFAKLCNAVPVELDDLLKKADSNQFLGEEKVRPLEQAVRRVAHEMGTDHGYNKRSNYWRNQTGIVTAQYDTIFNFAAYLIKTPSGALILPPTVTEYGAGVRVSNDKNRIEDRDVYYRVIRPASMIIATPTWRDYILLPTRPTKKMDPAAAPTTARLKDVWRSAVAEGWEFGIRLADKDFERRLRNLKEVFLGIITYHKLVTLGMINELHVSEKDTGILIDADSLSIGGTTVTIARNMQFNRNAAEWKPILIRNRKGRPHG